MNFSTDTILVNHVAQICHAANRELCKTLGDKSQPEWEKAPEWQRESARQGVRLHLSGNVTPRQSHESWMEAKRLDGWTYGPVKDSAKKTHPCMVPYEQLPLEQRAKDYLFRNIVHAFRDFFDQEEVESTGTDA